MSWGKALILPGALVALGGGAVAFRAWQADPPQAPEATVRACAFGKPSAPPQASGWASGVISGIRIPEGHLRLRSGQERISLLAAPWQIAGLVPGQRVRLRYEDYDGWRWLAPDSKALDARRFARKGVLVGVVQAVRKTQGKVTVSAGKGDRVFRARPEDLAAILPGEAVRLHWVRVGQVDWWAGPPGCPPAAPPP